MLNGSPSLEPVYVRAAGNSSRLNSALSVPLEGVDTVVGVLTLFSSEKEAFSRDQLRVLLAIVDIGGVPEVAAALGVAVTTIKTHLSRLFEKTGVARQADLVKLVAGFSTPLAS